MRTLRVTLWFNFAWAVLMLSASVLLLVIRLRAGTVDVISIGLSSLAGAYSIVAALAICGRSWALLISLFVAAGLTAFWFPQIAYNLCAFVTDDPMYLDSPATIIVAGITGLFFCAPAILLVAMYAIQFKTVLSMFRGSL